MILKKSEDKIVVVKRNQPTETHITQSKAFIFEQQAAEKNHRSENTDLTPKEIITKIQTKKDNAVLTTPRVDITVLHENEIKDSTWADKTEEKLMTLFTEDNIEIQMQSLDCRTTVCRIYLSDIDGEDLNIIRKKLADNVSSIVGNPELKMFDDNSIVIYLTKEIGSEGYVYPGDPEPVIMSMLPTSASSAELP